MPRLRTLRLDFAPEWIALLLLADPADVATRLTGEAKLLASGLLHLGGQGDLAALSDEVKRHLQSGYTHIKIKVGGAPIPDDLARIETAIALMAVFHTLSFPGLFAPQGLMGSGTRACPP